jgi:1,2-dihydroxy-3-keto-5-methylthiopentene dioxygenase
MAIVSIPSEDRILRDLVEVREYLAGIGIEYAQWESARQFDVSAGQEEILAAYGAEIDRLKQRGGYTTADVIDVSPETPNLESMLSKFNREHWHNEDEVRFIVRGRGVFHIRPRSGAVAAVEVEAGDLIRVPRGTWHWFDLCVDRRIVAIRLFQQPEGWTPHYTDSGLDRNYQPVCLGPLYVPARNQGIQS